MRALEFFVVVVASIMLCDALSCPRDINNKPYCTDVDPKTCPYGTTWDMCGHCKVCAKGPEERCGGIWNHGGTCGKGLFCHKNPKNWQSPGKCLSYPPPSRPKRFLFD